MSGLWDYFGDIESKYQNEFMFFISFYLYEYGEVPKKYIAENMHHFISTEFLRKFKSEGVDLKKLVGKRQFSEEELEFLFNELFYFMPEIAKYQKIPTQILKQYFRICRHYNEIEEISQYQDFSEDFLKWIDNDYWMPEYFWINYLSRPTVRIEELQKYKFKILETTTFSNFFTNVNISNIENFLLFAEEEFKDKEKIRVKQIIWNEISKSKELNEGFITEHSNKINWNNISGSCYFSDKFVIKNKKKLTQYFNQKYRNHENCDRTEPELFLEIWDKLDKETRNNILKFSSQKSEKYSVFFYPKFPLEIPLEIPDKFFIHF